jgi:C2H2-type zinc finger
MLETNDSKYLFTCPSFVEILQSWIGDVHEQDDLPKIVCSRCESKVEIALEIRETTRRSDEILRGLLFTKFSADKVDIGANSVFLPEMVVEDVKIKDEPDDDEILAPLAIDTANEIFEELETIQPVIVCEESTQRTRKIKRKDENLQETSTTVPAEITVDAKDEVSDDDDDADDNTDDPEYDDDEKTKEKRRKSSKRKEKVQSADTINRIMSEVSQSLVCHYCGKSTFTQPNRLKKHIYEYHSDTVFSCEICQKVFKSGNNLQRHKKLVHDKFRFKCDQCVCDFYTTSDLKRHKLDEHSGR